MRDLPDTFFTTPPEWSWWIIVYFFIGGIAALILFGTLALTRFLTPEVLASIEQADAMTFYAVVDGMGRTRRHVAVSLPLVEAIADLPHYQPPPADVAVADVP